MNKVKLKIKGKNRTAWFGLGFMQNAIKAEKPEGDNIFLVPLPLIIYHALAYSDERKGVDTQLSIYDIHDYLDKVGVHSDEVNALQLSFFKWSKTQLPKGSTEAEAIIDKAIKELTPEEKKKDTKSGKKTGK